MCVAHEGISFGAPSRLDQTHPAAALDPEVRMVAVARYIDAHVIRNLDDGFSGIDLVDLTVDGDLGHKDLE